MRKLYGHLAFTALLGFGGVVVTLMVARAGFYSDVLMILFFAGSVGAVVNNYFRVSKLSENPQAILNEIQNPVVILQLYVSMLLSGILAFVAYGLFLSGVLQGALFPRFTNADKSYEGISIFLSSMAPLNNIDTAKAILWGFIAGFSERFVPNIIDKLVSKAQDTEKKVESESS